MIMKTATPKPKVDVTLDDLFDYSKTVRPPAVILDDDDDDVQIVDPSKPSTSGRPHTVPNLEENIPVQGEAINENDWLEPPPSKPGCHRVLPADPTVLKIRQQKQELEKIWQASAQNIEEAAKLEERVTLALSQQQSDPHGRSHNDNSEEAPRKRQKILLQLQAETGESHGVRINVDDKLDKLFTHYAQKVGERPVTEYVFRFDGQQLNPNSSPRDFDLEDEDIVEVFLKGKKGKP